jgi:(1->4)-alpha-D-glucan 1-alpha-D-glucosylmutase
VSISVPPRATYRLQLHAGFTFEDAAGLANYLAVLGVSHVYCSPVLQAVPGSRHGYDVVDHSKVDADLGGADGFASMTSALRQAGMGLLLDIVPNHMAIVTPHNRWWWDVLENGTFSRYASYFDVDWDPPEARLRNLVLLPVLGDHYGRVLEAGELTLGRVPGGFVARYHEHAWPLSPSSVAMVLAGAAERCASDELAFLAGAHERLDAVSQDDVVALRRRHRDREVLRAMVERACAEQLGVAAAIDAEIGSINADPDALDRLLERQNYRLSFWRTASRDLGYRRFFDVNTLAGLRVEVDRVFRDTHDLAMGWVRSGAVDGLRVDHPDGLHDPAGYLRRLQDARPGTWVVVEKILGPGERLPDDWPVDGTTGYDFMARVSALFVDPAGEEPLTQAYAALTGEPVDYPAVLRAKKLQVLRDVLGSDVNRLTALLVELCERHRRQRDYTRHELHEAVREAVACFPVYRTYVPPEGPPSARDVAHVEAALAAAAAHRPDLDREIFAFLGDVLTGRLRGPKERDLLLRFQQFTGPAMAKGAEDTAFYCYNRLTSLNEVGGDPGRFGVTVEDFHAGCREALRRWPRGLLATSTHDSKRSEDVRARIHLLAEAPEAWSAAVSRWMERNARHWGAETPDRNAEYLYYQALVGAWPIDPPRMKAYMEKAAREAKVRTSWVTPNAGYEAALSAFVEATLADRGFVADLGDFVTPLVEPGRIGSLSQVLVKMTAPGIPDIYQGTEVWDLSLVDPDNRRPVDYETRRRLLAEVGDRPPAEAVMAAADSGLPKLWVIERSLDARRRFPEAFGPEGAYEPLEAEGRRSEHVVAYVRGGRVATIVPRFPLRLGGSWQSTTVNLPDGDWENRLTGERVRGGAVGLAGLLQRFPVALLYRDFS